MLLWVNLDFIRLIYIELLMSRCEVFGMFCLIYCLVCCDGWLRLVSSRLCSCIVYVGVVMSMVRLSMVMVEMFWIC